MKRVEFKEAVNNLKHEVENVANKEKGHAYREAAKI